MSTKFSAFYRYMFQLPAFCGCSPRCRINIVDRHVDLLPTARHMGGSKLSSLSRDTRYLAKYHSSELQAEWMCEAMSRASTRCLPASCGSVSLLNIKAGCDCACGVWSGGCGDVELWQPHTDACSLCLSLDCGGRPPKKKKKKQTLLSPCPTPFPQLIMYRSHCVCSRH